MRHDLLDAGWRTRMVLRHVLVITPLCAVLGLLPGSWTLRALVAGFVFICSVFTVAIYTDEIRTARLRQHGIPGPDDRDGGNRPG